MWEIYHQLVSKGRSELGILLDAEPEELKKLADEKIADAIINNREGKIPIQPGFDGEYGYPIFNGKIKKAEIRQKHEQKGLGDFY